MSDCTCCDIVKRLSARGKVKDLGEFWYCNIREGHQRPALVVQSKEHRAHLADLEEEELRSLGPALQAASKGLQYGKGVERVYVQLFNEGAPGHVHFHIVPRLDADDVKGPELRDAPLPIGRAPNMEDCLQKAAEEASQRREPSTLVRAIKAACDGWREKISLYTQFSAGKEKKGFKSLDRGERYVLFWLAVAIGASGLFASTGGLFAATDRIPPPLPVFDTWWPFGIFAVIAAYRILDMVLFETGVMLNSNMTHLTSVPRALVLRVLNLLEVALLTAALLLAAPSSPKGKDALFDGLNLLTFQPEIQQEQAVLSAVMCVSWFAVIIIFATGITIMISQLGQTFTDKPKASQDNKVS